MDKQTFLCFLIYVYLYNYFCTEKGRGSYEGKVFIRHNTVLTSVALYRTIICLKTFTNLRHMVDLMRPFSSFCFIIQLMVPHHQTIKMYKKVILKFAYKKHLKNYKVVQNSPNCKKKKLILT